MGRDDILGVMVMWFIMGLVSLPSTDMYFKLGLPNILGLLSIETRDSENLPGNGWYNTLASNLQWNAPLDPSERINEHRKKIFFTLFIWN